METFDLGLTISAISIFTIILLSNIGTYLPQTKEITKCYDSKYNEIQDLTCFDEVPADTKSFAVFKFYLYILIVFFFIGFLLAFYGALYEN